MLETGAVRAVKPLGVLCMIDDGEAGENVCFLGRFCIACGTRVGGGVGEMFKQHLPEKW